MADTPQPLNQDEDQFFDKYKPTMSEEEFFNKYDQGRVQNAHNFWFNKGPYEGSMSDYLFQQTPLGRVLSAFGQGAHDAWGQGDQTALGAELQWEAKQKESDHGLVYGFHTSVMRPAAAAIDSLYKPLFSLGSGIAGGVGQLGEELKAAAVATPEALAQSVPEQNKEAVKTAGKIAAAPFGGAGELLGLAASGAGLEAGIGLPEGARRLSEDHLTTLQEARSRGVIGEGEAGYFRTVEPSPEALEARREASVMAGEPYGPETREQFLGPQVVPTQDEIARQIDPELFSKIDQLQTEQENLRLSRDNITAQLKPEQVFPAQLVPLPEGFVRNREGVIYPTQGESLPEKGLAVAIRKTDGTVYIGKPGEIHFQVSEKFPATKDNVVEGTGFVNPEGEYLNRKQALDWVKEQEKENFKPSTDMNSLDAMDYRERVPESKKASNPGLELESPEVRIRSQMTREEYKEQERLKSYLKDIPYRLQELDEQIRDFIPDVSEAKRRADAALGSEEAEFNEFNRLAEEHTKAKEALVDINKNDLNYKEQVKNQQDKIAQIEKDLQAHQEMMKQNDAFRKMIQAQAFERAIALQEAKPKIVNAYRDAADLIPPQPETKNALADSNNKSKSSGTTTTAPSAAEQIIQTIPEYRGGLKDVKGGTLKESGLNKNIMIDAIQKGFDARFQDTPLYHSITHADQGQKAFEYLESEPKAAMEVAMGDREPPSGIHPEAILIAAKEKAEAEGDIDMIQSLSQTRLGREASVMGQRLGLLRNLNENIDPTAIIRGIQDLWQEKGSARMTKTIEEIRDRIKDNLVNLQSQIGDFLKSIECDY